MKSTIIISLLLLSIIWSCQCNDSFECPNKCECTDKSIHCTRSKFLEFPNLKFKTMTYLTISGSHIKILKKGTLEMFKDLKHLDLSNNQISVIEPGALDGPINLQTLNLNNNQIENLPDDILTEHIYSLNRLFIRNNNLKVLPTSFEKLLNVKRIDLSSNAFQCECGLEYFSKYLKDKETQNRLMTCSFVNLNSPIEVAKFDFDHYCKNQPMKYLPEPPKLKKELKNIITTLGDRVILICETKNITNDKVKWILPFESKKYLSFYLRNHILIIDEVHDIHKGLIQCEAENNVGKVISTADISIVEPQKPYIIEGPTSAVVNKGDDITFTCRAAGYPTPLIDWLWVKTSVVKLESNNKFIVRSNKLLIKNVDETETEGRFVCYASNSAGSTKVSAYISVVSDKNETAETAETKRDINDGQIIEIIDDARKKIDAEFKRTKERLQNPSNRGNVGSLFRQPNLAALELAKATEIYESALDKVIGVLRDSNVKINVSANGQNNIDLSRLLTPEQIAIISQLSGCQSSTDELYCSQQLCFHNKYRTIDGKCNNLINPRKGSAVSAFYRLLPPEYENGINTPIGWSSNKLHYGYPKPSARLVSSKLLHAHKISQDPKHTSMIMQWGQFIDHDLDFTPVDAGTSRYSDGLSCNETCVNDSPCFPILTPPGDLRVKKPCIGFSRSISTCGTGQSSIILGKLHYREQVNQITSYIDASNVYGSDELEATELRDLTYDEGKLREGQITQFNKKLLPFNIRGQVDCQQHPGRTHVPCFKAGDHRSNENLGLLAMHTIWMREHNRLAEQLRFLNNHWSGDKIYFETRKIVGALMQHITYNEWLPEILGEEGFRLLGEYRGYNDSVDSTISNVFATAAMRFGHSLINPILYRLDENFETIPQGNLPLHRAFFAPDMILQDGGIDPILRGLYAKNSKAVQSEQPMNSELIEKLFAMAHEVSLDLGALNIQRGRDHGLPSYNSWRKYCGLKPAENFKDFINEIPSEEILEKMRQIYGHPGNVDLFAGGILEKHVSDGLVGPTFRCLLINQFQRSRDGDRFWYENKDQFSSSQLSQIKQFKLSQTICDNGDNITKVQSDIFLMPTKSNPMINCNQMKRFNLLSWKECQENYNFRFQDYAELRTVRIDDLKSCESKFEEIEQRVKKLENANKNV